MSRVRTLPLPVAYAVLVTLTGLGVLLLALSRASEDLRRPDLALGVLACLLVAAELRAVRVVTRRGSTDAVNLSGAFACALLLLYGWPLAVAVQAVAALADDVRGRVAWWKAAFNVGQYSLALAGAGAVLWLLAPAGTVTHLSTDVLPAAVAACTVFFLLNTVLPGAGLALHEGAPLARSLINDLPLQASVNGVVVAMAPLVVALMNDSLWLVALLVVPVLAVHRGALSAIERDHLSLHDSLTGLPNQVAFRDALVDQVEQAAEAGRHVGVLALTLDHFSDVNRTLGHAAGDALLEQVARRLSDAVPDDAVVSRFGTGGSFVVAVPDLGSPWDASAWAERLLQQFSDPYSFAESAFALRASIGLTVAPLHGTDPDHLVQHAEVARDVARRDRSGLEVYSAERNSFTERRLAVLKGLGPALRRREMSVHFQPQVDLATGRVSGFEALLRWDHAELGTVPPDEFVALAEHSGMMREVTDYVLDEALRRAAEWRALGSTATVSVNVSASVLQDKDLPKRIARRLALWGVPSSALVIELTETAVMSDPDHAIRVMRELRALHVGLSLDDYGTGYASLAYLTSLPVDEVKIDKSFVSRMASSRTDQVVVRSTLDLARELGLRVVAEGVESPEVAALLAESGCHLGQGFHFGQPVAPQHLELLAHPERHAS